MSDKSQNSDDIEEFSRLNRIFKSKAVQMILDKIGDGTFGEFLDDWKWIFAFSRRYARMIIFYTILGVCSSTLSLVSSVASKYMIDTLPGLTSAGSGSWRS
ncbi:MAG: hypothetical protein LUE14_02490 [Clostridiales bacterium]|nr:hypothetical protein [Clostridiales bacterium]